MMKDKVLISKKIALIIPYFGLFNNYFLLWLESARENPEVDWLIFTDNKAPNNKPENVIWYSMQFRDLVSRIKETVGEFAELPNPYKLCDYKPAYGHVFENELKKYDFWGFCDLDLIFGKISHFVNDDILESYDKINKHGHMVIMKNTQQMREMYKQDIEGYYPIRDVARSKAIMFFDEGGKYGFPQICAAHSVKCYYERCFADIDYNTYEFRYYWKSGDAQLRRIVDCFIWKSGSIFSYKEGHQLDEVLYVHLQKRRMEIELEGTKKELYIYPSILSSKPQPKMMNMKNRAKFYFRYLIIKQRNLKARLLYKKEVERLNIGQRWKNCF